MQTLEIATYYVKARYNQDTGMKSENAVLDTHLQPIFDATPVPMVLSRPDGSFEYVNPAFLDMLGYTEQECYADGLIISHPDDVALNRQVRQSLMKRPFTPVIVEKRYLHKSGKVIPALLTIVAQPDEQRRVHRFIAQIVNLEQQKQTEHALQRFRTLIQQSNDAMFVIRAEDARILEVNNKVSEVLGYSQEELLTLCIMDIEATLSSLAQWQSHIDHVRSHKTGVVEGQHIRKNGSTLPVEVSISYVEQDHQEYIVALARDLTERKRNEAIIWQQGNFDALTGLPNRWLLTNTLEQSTTEAARKQQRLVVMSLDLDFFKQVNDSFGHLTGDQLLVQAAQRIQHCLRAEDTVARMGGDEFTLILPAPNNLNDIDRTAAQIIDTLSDPFELHQSRVYISASIGISVYPDDAHTPDGLMQTSDQALYSAKQEGRRRYRYFTPSMQRISERKNWLRMALRECLSHHQLSLVYQPIVRLSDRSLALAEALLRWQHPQKGAITPQEFISVAEENGTICDIGDWVFKQALSELQQHQQQLPDDFLLSINSSPIQFRSNNKTNLLKWRDILREHHTTGHHMIVEITEGVTMDLDDGASDILNVLRAAGFRIAIDDFGTGYSSLTYLRRLNMDYLKIDKAFVAEITSNAEDLALCEAMIVMAHKLGMKVIAEGIETAEQADILTLAGCDYGQGYYFSRPTSMSTIIQRYT